MGETTPAGATLCENDVKEFVPIEGKRAKRNDRHCVILSCVRLQTPKNTMDLSGFEFRLATFRRTQGRCSLSPRAGIARSARSAF